MEMFTESLALHCMARTERVWANVLFLSDKEAQKLFKCKILGCHELWHENCQALRDQVPAIAPLPWPPQGGIRTHGDAHTHTHNLPARQRAHILDCTPEGLVPEVS